MIIDFFNRGGGGSASGITSGQVQTMIDSAMTIESARTEDTYAKVDSLSGYTTTAYTQDLELSIAGSLNLKQDKLIAGTNITISGNTISAQGGGDPNAEKVQVLTQAQYNALTGYSANTTYVISDAAAVDMDDYASQDDLDVVSGAVNTQLALKADKQSVTAFTGTSGYYGDKKFPKWNEQGVITGDYSTVTAGFSYVNGAGKNILMSNGGTITIFAPTAAGTQNQMLLSNGSGAPVWSTQKIVFCTQTQYDALATKDSTTLYIITGD